MPAPLVVFTDVTDLSIEPARAILTEAGYDTEVLDLVHSPDIPDTATAAVGLVVGWAQVTAEVMDAFPQLRVLATYSVGTDMIDLDAAAARGIEVINLAGVATEEVATHALGLILTEERGLHRMHSAVAAGGWLDDIEFMPRRLSELTLGLYGLGRIGTHLAEIAQPIFGSVITHDPFVDSHPTIELVDADELLARSDVLSLHVPSTETTRGMVNAEFLAALKPDCTLINVSRGDLIDEPALAHALRTDALRGYATDVLIGDPPPTDNELRASRAFITPHAAFMSETSLRGYLEKPAHNVVNHLRKAKEEP